jgi:membrane protein DedA with SNARE-associated domain
MNEMVQFLERHDCWLLIAAVLGRQACLPIPANLLLVAAGALARSGKLSFAEAIFLSTMTFLVADLAWYEAGRRFGDRILHFVCGLTRDTHSCFDRANSVFSQHGVRTLLFSKFVIGFDAVAAPLTGRAGVPRIEFLAFDGAGAAFWSTTYAALGYIFSDQLDLVATHIERLGAFLTLAIAAGFVFYLARRLARWLRFVRQFSMARITPEELRYKLDRGEDVLLIDLQGGHRHSATQCIAIPGSVCIPPYALEHREVDISRQLAKWSYIVPARRSSPVRGSRSRCTREELKRSGR